MANTMCTTDTLHTDNASLLFLIKKKSVSFALGISIEASYMLLHTAGNRSNLKTVIID